MLTAILAVVCIAVPGMLIMGIPAALMSLWGLKVKKGMKNQINTSKNEDSITKQRERK